MFSGFYSSELFVNYEIDIIQPENNSVNIKITNTGIIQSKKPILFIGYNEVIKNITTNNCYEGNLISNKTTRDVSESPIKVQFERMSVGTTCIIDINGINQTNISEVMITTEGKSVHYNTSNSFIFIFFVMLVILDIIIVFIYVPLIIDGIIPLSFSLIRFKKNEQNKKIQLDIKKEFGVKLFIMDIEILKKINCQKKTLSQISTALKIPKFMIKRRLHFLTKYELLDDKKLLNGELKIILDQVF